MYVIHVHSKEGTGKSEVWKLADTSYVIQLTVLKKCCNITKVIVGNLKYIRYTCILVYKCKKCIL